MRSLNSKLLFWLPVLCLIAALLLLLLMPVAIGENGVFLYFVNVGKGDACLITCGDAAFLVDTGKKDYADRLLLVFKKTGVKKLDGVILTHMDKDHVGGLKKLLKSDIQVEKLYCGKYFCLEEKDTHPVLDAVRKYPTELQWLEAGDQIPLGEAVQLRVIGPIRGDTAEEDNNSLVMVLDSPYGKVLLAADMKTQEEQDLLSSGAVEKCDVLKVAHHGKDDSTGKSFVLMVKPKIAVISTSQADEGDSADAKVISRLWNVGTEVYITQDTPLAYRVEMNESGITVTELDE